MASAVAVEKHGGDEREGDEKGDDEKIFIELTKVHPAVAYIGFVVNSYSGQELDDVHGASCHLFDYSTFRDLARFQLSNTKFLDKHTALVMGMLYRDPADANEWGFGIISEAAQGRTAHDNVDELQNHLRRRPVPPLSPPRDMPGAGSGMLSNVAKKPLLVDSHVRPMPVVSAAAQPVASAQPALPVAVPLGIPL